MTTLEVAEADDSNFAASVQCCACGGGTRCDIVVSGTSHQTSRHGTYEQKGSCNGSPAGSAMKTGGVTRTSTSGTIQMTQWYIGSNSCSDYGSNDPDGPDVSVG